MKLWGWLGPDHADLVDASPGVAPWLASQVGLMGLTPTPPVELDLASVPPSRLDPAMRAALVSAFPTARLSDDARDRVPLSLGQSYPDQLARRAGSVGFVADLVASPETTDEVVGLLGAAAATGFRVMPVGGATSVVGGLAATADERPVVVADMRRMNRILGQGTGTVTAQAGIGLAALERELGAAGRTLGHFPQSFEAATLGGSIMANGSGQRSDAYGRIGDMLVSARLATPGGLWSTESFRHAAGGPWLGGLVSGSEGLFGILTDATLRTRPKPEHVEDRAWLLPSLRSAIDAVRLIKESGAHLAMVRVSDAAETAFLSGFRLARRGLARPPLLERLVLSAKGAPPDPLLVVAGYEGSAVGAKAAFAQAGDVFSAAGGVALGPAPGASWRKSRFEAPHLRESIMARGPRGRHVRDRRALEPARSAAFGLVRCATDHHRQDAGRRGWQAGRVRPYQPLLCGGRLHLRHGDLPEGAGRPGAVARHQDGRDGCDHGRRRLAQPPSRRRGRSCAMAGG